MKRNEFDKKFHCCRIELPSSNLGYRTKKFRSLYQEKENNGKSWNSMFCHNLTFTYTLIFVKLRRMKNVIVKKTILGNKIKVMLYMHTKQLFSK